MRWSPQGTALRVLVGVFLIAHGLVNLLYFVNSDDPKYPMTASKSWLLNAFGLRIEVVRPLVLGLAVFAAVGFCLVALSFWGVLPSAWFTALAVASATASLLLIAVTWNIQFVVGAAINIAILFWAFA